MAKKWKIRQKGLIIVVFFMLGSAVAYGQEFSYGIYGGITASQVDGDSYSGFNKLGGTGGLFFKKHIYAGLQTPSQKQSLLFV